MQVNSTKHQEVLSNLLSQLCHVQQVHKVLKAARAAACASLRLDTSVFVIKAQNSATGLIRGVDTVVFVQAQVLQQI